MATMALQRESQKPPQPHLPITPQIPPKTYTHTNPSPPPTPPSISHLTKHGYLFGSHLDASLSPLLHSIVYKHLSLNWAQLRLDTTDMSLFLRLRQDPSFYGASVTMPHKVNILQYLDELTPECEAVGACNTMYIRDIPDSTSHSGTRRIFCGTNTDVIGVRDSFLKTIPAAQHDSLFRGKPALVIGSGGAARSAIYALRTWLGATNIYLVNRFKSEVDAVKTECSSHGYGSNLIHVSTPSQARALEGVGAIVACVPDFPPASPEEIQVREVVQVFLGEKAHKGAMLEMCYNPTPYTMLGKLAEESGWRVILGTEALIWQGLEQDRYWTGRGEEGLPVGEIKREIERQVEIRSRARVL